MTIDLERRRRAVSPRHTRPDTPLRAMLIHGAATAAWLLLFARAFGGGGLFAYSVGIAYAAYDTALLLFVAVQTGPLLRRPAALAHQPTLPTLGVIIAAHNESASLSVTLAALLAQTSPPDTIVIADDGSDDATAAVLATRGLACPQPGAVSRSGTLLWLRLPRGGKARALNAALGIMTDDLLLTVDADTRVDTDAVLAMRRAFAEDGALVAATGVLFPICAPGPSGRLFQWFQTYEYMRNFLSRYAWGRQDGLLLISGAFAAYRRQAVLDVGGFDPDCLVEDYELTHRLRDYGAGHGLVWRTDIVGAARARTEAPGTLPAFLRQRRRWFGGFLQTQLWYRHMIGDPRYGRLGTRMLPVKALDTMQPLYGLTGIALLLASIALGHGDVAIPAAGVIAAKIAFDLAFTVWSILLYRRWLGDAGRVHLGWALLAGLIEPFTFQPLRHLGAALGWTTFLTGDPGWNPQARAGLGLPQSLATAGDLPG